MAKQIILLGSGGHAMSCMNIVDSLGYSLTLGGKPQISDFVKDTRLLDKEQWDNLCKKFPLFILGVGQIHSPQNRIDIVKEIESRACSFIPLIAPDASVSVDATIGNGVFIGHKCVINLNVSVGEYAILNTSCILEHESSVGNFCHISTGAVINGQARIGNRVFVGSNAVVLQQVHVCDDVTIGAGSVVINDIKEKGIYVGNPARKIR